MKCPSCEKEIPNNSQFCLHCGGRLGSQSEAEPVFDYEFTDYVKTIGIKYESVGKLHPVSEFAQDCWRDYQSSILPEIQKWSDDGWKPISEVGPAAFRIREEPLGFLTLIFDNTKFEAQRHIIVDEFRVKMRRKRLTQ